MDTLAVSRSDVDGDLLPQSVLRLTRSGLQTIPALIHAASALFFGASLCTLNSGCQQMVAAQAAQTSVDAAQTTAQAATSAAQTTAQTSAQAAQTVLQGAEQIALLAVPTSVIAQANQILAGNNLTNWGKPIAIYTADQMYVFVYAPATHILGKPQPRVLVVDALGRTARLQRLQEQGL